MPRCRKPNFHKGERKFTFRLFDTCQTRVFTRQCGRNEILTIPLGRKIWDGGNFPSCMHESNTVFCSSWPQNKYNTKMFTSFSVHPSHSLSDSYSLFQIHTHTHTHISGVDMVVRHASSVNNVESGAGSVLAETESLHRASLPSTEWERRVSTLYTLYVDTDIHLLLAWCDLKSLSTVFQDKPFVVLLAYCQVKLFWSVEKVVYSTHESACLDD